MTVRYLLDTNVVIALLKDPQGSERQQLQCLAPADVALSVVVSHELYFGAYRSARVTENLHRLDAMQFQVLPFDLDDAREAGKIRAELAHDGLPIGPYDVLIAGQARCRDLVLVTNNRKEFDRVPNLLVESW